MDDDLYHKDSLVYKLGLRKDISIDLNSSQSDLYQKLKREIHPKELNFTTFFWEQFIRTDRRSIGSLSPSHFEFKKKIIKISSIISSSNRT